MTLLQLLQSMNKQQKISNDDVAGMVEWLKPLPREFKRTDAVRILGIGSSSASKRLNQAQAMGLLKRREVKDSSARIVWQKVGKV